MGSPHHRDAPVDDRPGTSLTNEAQDSQPPSPASDDAPEPSFSPQLVSGSSSSSSGSSGSSSSSSTTQPPPQSIDNDDDDNDVDNDDDGGGDDMDEDTQPGIDKMDGSIPANSPTHSEEQMIGVTTA